MQAEYVRSAAIEALRDLELGSYIRELPFWVPDLLAEQKDPAALTS